jgi:hypothetical protein
VVVEDGARNVVQEGEDGDVDGGGDSK